MSLLLCPSTVQQYDGSMRKCKKSALMRYLISLSSTRPDSAGIKGIVYDGCALIHHIPWPKLGTIVALCLMYLEYIKGLRSNVTNVVVFDNYEVMTSKDPEQKGRRMCTQSADVLVSSDTPVPSSKAVFLSNKKNKQAFITMLGSYLQGADINVVHATEEGDADVVIVKEALMLTTIVGRSKVIADDTDILVLLLYHVENNMDILLKTKTELIDIRAMQRAIGDDLRMLLPFSHAASGCDTTSSLFGVGKIKAFKILQKSPDRFANLASIGDTEMTQQQLLEMWEEFMIKMYHCGSSPVRSLDQLRA